MNIIEQIEQTPHMLSSKQVAELFGKHQDTIVGWVNEGIISATRIKGVLFFDPATLAGEIRAMHISRKESK